MKLLIPFLFLIAMGCASSKVSSEKTAPAYTLPSPENLKLACDKGNPLACFEVGQEKVSKEQWKEALEIFSDNCLKRIHPYSCTQAGYIHSKLGDQENAMKFSYYGCQKMDAVGCYNLACYSCRKKDSRKTLDFLKRAERLGFDIGSNTAEDPDLGCLKGNAEFAELMKQSKKRKHRRTTTFHVVPQFYSMAFIPPYGFEKNDTNTLTFTDSSGAFVRFLRTPEKFSDIIKRYKVETKDLDRQNEEFQMNGYRGFVDRRTIDTKPSQFKEMTVILGNEDYVVAAHGGYPVTFEKELAPRILRTVASLIFDPDAAVTEDKLFFTVDTKNSGFQFTGLSVDNFIEFAFKNPESQLPVYPLVQFFVIDYKTSADMKKDPLKGFCTDSESSPPKDFEKKKTVLLNKKGFYCEGDLSDRPVHAKNWVLDNPEKKQRILIRTVDEVKSSNQDRILKFISTFQIKKK